MFGYHGRCLCIDVSGPEHVWLPLETRVLRAFLGGSGLASYLLWRQTKPGLDPLSPGAALVFCLGPLVGTPLTTSAKFTVAAKSPLTDRLNDSLSSSHFALAAKKCGFDALVVFGRCPQSSILIVEDGKPRLEEARDLWGLETPEARDQLRDRLGAQFQFAVIGPAGENLVRYATLSHENRHAGRGGLGAVLGSKNLKAIAVAGSQRVSFADPESLVRQARSLSERSLGPATAKYRELGTVANLVTFNRLAALPTRNFQQGSFEQAEALGGVALAETRRQARHSCAACTIGCEHIFASPAGTARIEYESLFALGSLCGIGDPNAVIDAARSCDQLGLDTISTGATLAFAMECAQKGYLDASDLRFGNAGVFQEWLPKIARRQGLGNLLAEGTRRMAQTLGRDAADFAPHVKGLELPGYEPRTLQTMALGLAVNPRGADHNRSGAYEIDFSHRADRFHGTPDTAVLAIETEDKAALMDSLIVCKFLRGALGDLYADGAAMIQAITGWDVTAEEMRDISKRIVNLKKLYNIREGWTPAEDTLPRRFLMTPLEVPDSEAASLPAQRLQSMIAAYNLARGWSSEGYVPESLCGSLGLTDLLASRARL